MPADTVEEREGATALEDQVQILNVVQRLHQRALVESAFGTQSYGGSSTTVGNQASYASLRCPRSSRRIGLR